MQHALALIVVLPLAGFLLNGLAGNRLGKRFVSAVGCGLPIAAFVVAVKCFLDLAARNGAPLVDDRLHVGADRRSHVRDRLLLRSPHRGHGADRDRRRLAHSHLLDRLHEGRHELRALFRVPQSLPVLHADAGARQVAARAVRRLGRRGARVVPAHRLLVRGPGQGARGKEGVHHQPHRRRRVPARHVRPVPGVRDARHGPDQRRVRRAVRCPPCRRAWSASCCSSAPPASRRRFRSTSGCPTRWRDRRRCRR